MPSPFRWREKLRPRQGANVPKPQLSPRVSDVERSPIPSANSDPAQVVNAASLHDVSALKASPDERRDFWDQAYDHLKAKNPKLFKTYQKCISASDISDNTTHSTIDLETLGSVEREHFLAKRIEERLQAMKEGQWKIAVGTSEIVVVDVCYKVAEKILFAKDFITAAVSNEPHAALAWAGASMLLPLLLNSPAQDKAAIEGLADISDILLRYRVIEKLYGRSTPNLTLDGNVEALNLRRSFEKKMVAMYSQIFEYQMGMTSHYAHSSPNRYLRDLVVPYDWQGMRAAILSKDRFIKDDLSVLDQTQLHAKLEEQALLLEKASQDATSYFKTLLSTMNRVEKNLTIREANDESEKREKERKEIMQALSSDYSDLKDITDDKVPGTCQWFLDHTGFRRWTNTQEPSMIFLTAGPGCGKSVLMRSLVDNYIEPVRPIEQDQISCYYFFRSSGKIGEGRRVSTSTEATDALSAILHQVLVQRPAMMSKVTLAWRKHGTKLATEFSVLWEILKDCGSGDRIECIVDALDECGHDSRFQLISRIRAYYSQPLEGPHGLCFILSGRPYFNSEYRFLDLVRDRIRSVHIDMEEVDLGAEMSLVITAQVERLDFLEQGNRRYLEMRLRNFQTDTRTYLWLRLLFDGLRYDLSLENMDERDIDKVVETLPRDLYSAYDAILKRSSDERLTRLLLHIILGAGEPFKVEELQIAFNLALAEDVRNVNYERLKRLSNATFKKNVAGLCGAFITFVGERAFIFHLTAWEFLRTPGSAESRAPLGLTWAYTFDLLHSYHILFRLCVMILLDPRVTQVAKVVSLDLKDHGLLRDKVRSYCRDLPLLRYASIRWREHLFNAAGGRHPATTLTEGGPEQLSIIGELCDLSTDLFWSWYLCFWCFAPRREPKVPVSDRSQLASKSGFPIFDYWMLAGHGSRKVVDEALLPIAEAWKMREGPIVLSEHLPYTASRGLDRLWDFITREGQDHLCTALLHAGFSQRDENREKTLELFSQLPNGKPYACVLLAYHGWENSANRDIILDKIVSEWFSEKGFTEQVPLDTHAFISALSAGGLLGDPGIDSAVKIEMEELLIWYAALIRNKALAGWLVENSRERSMHSLYGKTLLWASDPDSASTNNLLLAPWQHWGPNPRDVRQIRETQEELELSSADEA